MINYSALIRKLQHAINQHNGKLLVNMSQFYSVDQDRPINKWTIKQVSFPEDKHKPVYVDLFVAFSQLQVLLFLRDYWYLMNGWDLPMDNDKWNEIRRDKGSALLDVRRIGYDDYGRNDTTDYGYENEYKAET